MMRPYLGILTPRDCRSTAPPLDYEQFRKHLHYMDCGGKRSVKEADSYQLV